MNVTRRVLVISDDYGSPSGGGQLAERYAVLLARRFEVRAVRFFSRSAAQNGWLRRCHQRPASFKRGGVQVRQLESRSPLVIAFRAVSQPAAWARPPRLLAGALFVAAYGPALRREIARADLVHLYFGGLPALSWPIARLVGKAGVPLALTPFWHNEPSDQRFGSLGEIILPGIARRAALTVAMTPFERDQIASWGVAPDRLVVCPGGPIVANTPDPTAFRQRHGLGDDPVVLFLGRQVRQKGRDRLIAAAGEVWLHAPRTRFVLAGPIPPAMAVRDNQLDPRLLNLGELSFEEKSAALAACTVLCVPSEVESLGLVYLEAWAMRRPVVALRLPVLEHVIADGEDGLLTDRSPAAVAEALLALIHDPARADRLGETGFRKVTSQYDWPVLADRLGDAYDAVLDRARPERVAVGYP
ncbi:MAG: glycosyltransferase family 4 protein [Dehalococcoidia bacterium]